MIKDILGAKSTFKGRSLFGNLRFCFIMINKEYLNSEEWKSKRKEIIQRDSFTCCACGAFGKTLNVHHLSYDKDREYWDYPNSNFVTLCSDCHKKIHGYKDGKLKKSISELRRIAVERSSKKPSSDLYVEIKNGNKFPLIYINGALFKSYSYAYYLSRVRRLLKGKIIIHYIKPFCTNIFGKKSKITTLKNELKELAKLGVVSNYNSYRFELNNIIESKNLAIYNELIKDELHLMTDSEEFLLPRILMPLDVFKSDIKFHYKIIISYILNEGTTNLDETDKNKLCDLLNCDRRALSIYLRFMKSKGYIVDDKINESFTLDKENLMLYYYKHIPMPSYTYIENSISRGNSIVVNNDEMNKLANNFSLYCSWTAEKRILFKIGIINDVNKDNYLAERLPNGRLKIN